MTFPTRTKNPAGSSPTAASAAGGEPETPESSSLGGKQRSTGKLGRLIWPVICLFQLGLVAGVYLSKSGGGSAPTSDPSPAALESAHESAHESAREPAHETAAHERPNALSAHSIAKSAQGDEYLKRGWYEHALTRYESSAADRSGGPPHALRFKIALCLDGLGHWDRALTEYGEAAGRGGKEDDPISIAARLARARLWFRMRNTEEARRALGELLLRPGRAATSAAHQTRELVQLLGQTLALETLGSEAPGPKSEAALAFPVFEWRPEAQFDWNESLGEHSPNPGATEPQSAPSLDVWPTGPALQDCDVTVTSQRGTASEIIRRVADSANVPCVFTDAAREAGDRVVWEISTPRLPWPAVISCLAEPLQITWELRDEKLHLATNAEIDPSDRIERTSRAAKWILLAVARDGQRSPEAAAAYLGLGGLSFAEGNTTEAEAWYERFIREYPRSGNCVPAHFDLGVVRRTAGDMAGARQSFLRAVDTSPSHPLAPLAHLFVGRVSIEDGDFEGALAPLRRAASMSTPPETRAAAVIDLATALMLVDNWRAAQALLQEHHALLEQPETNATLVFLSAYARYRLQTNRKLAAREGQALVSALMGLQGKSALLPSGVLLVGRAYAAVGLSEQMAETFEQARRSGVPQPIALEISHDLAEFAVLTGNSDEAIRNFTSVFRNARPARSKRAGMRLAELALAEQRADDCLRICRQLLVDAERAEVSPILKMMGQAFEIAGEHTRAAQCYAGQRPSP